MTSNTTLPPQVFADWWQEHTAHTGNTYSTRVAFEAIRCFVLESEAMSQAGQIIGRQPDSARIQALDTLTQKLGVTEPRPNQTTQINDDALH